MGNTQNMKAFRKKVKQNKNEVGVAAMDKDQSTNMDMVYYLFRCYLTGARAMFKQLDTDRDEFITQQEWKTIFPDVDVTQFIAELDTDGDAKISFKEFVSFMTQDMLQDDKLEEEESKSDGTITTTAQMTYSSFVLCVRGITKYFKVRLSI